MFSTAMFGSGTKAPAKHQVLLREAVTAVKKGDRAVARTLLREIIHGDPRNPQAWLWLAGVAESVAEVTHCLEKVLEIEPDNQMATERLSMLRLLRYANSDGQHPAQTAAAPGAPAAPPAGAPAHNALAVRNAAAPPAARGVAPESPAAALAIPRPAPAASPRPLAALSVPTICTLCQNDIDLRKHQCTRCGALSSLRTLRDLFANRATEPNLIKAGVERWKVEHDRGPSAESSFALALGYLNLHDFQKAVEYLRIAKEFNPERKDLIEALDKLERCPVIMVVDDSATIRHLVAHTLHQAGYIVRMAEDGIKALTMLQDGLPDMVFLDINMPRMDGYSVCKVIKHDAATKQVPVVMLSGKDGFFDKVKGRLAGSSEYVTKPFEGDSLIRTVEKHIPAHKRGGVDRTLTGAGASR